MRRSKLIAGACLIGIVFPTWCMADPLDPRQVPAEAKWLIHVDMDAARPTKTWDALYTRLINDDMFQQKVGQIEQLTNMQFPRDVHDITIYGREAGDEAGVVVLHGNIDRNRTLGFLQLNETYSEKAYGERRIVAWQDQEKKLYAAFFNESTVVVGRSEANIQAGLDVMDSKIESIKAGPLGAGSKPQMLAYVAVRELSRWKQKAGEAQSPVVKQIQGGWLSLNETDGNAVLHASLSADNSEVADQLQTILRGIKAMVSLAGSGENADPRARTAASLLKTVEIAKAGDTVAVDCTISMEQVKDLISKLPIDADAAKP